MKKVFIPLLALFLLLALGIGLLQSGWGKNLARSYLEEALAQSGYTVEIGRFEGTIPHAIDLQNVRVASDALSVSIDSLSTRLSLLALVKKELLFTDLNASGVSWEEKPNAPVRLGKGQGLSFAIRIKHFQLKNVRLPDGRLADFEGALRIGKKNKEAFLDLAASLPEYPDTKAHGTVYLDGTGTLRAKASFESPTLKPLPWNAPFDASSNLRFSLKGRGGIFKGRVYGSIAPRDVAFDALAPYVEKTWTVNARIGNPAGVWEVSKFDAQSESVRIQGSASKTRASFILKSEDPPFLAKAETSSLGENGLSVKANVSFPELSLKEISLQNVQGKADFVWKDKTASGELFAAALLDKTLWKGKSAFSYGIEGPLVLTGADLRSASSSILGDLEIRPDRIAVGRLQIDSDNLQDFPFGLYGSAKGAFDWFALNGKQVLSGDLETSNLYWKALFFQSARIETSLLDPFDNPEGRFVLAGENGRIDGMNLDTARFETLFGGPSWPFSIAAQGRWKHPLEVNLDGAWHTRNSDLTIRLETLFGSFYNSTLSIAKPADIEFFPGLFRLSGLDLALSDARLFLQVEEIQNETVLTAQLERFPLDLLSLNPLDIPIAGKTNLTLNLSEKKGSVSGTLKAAIDSLQVESEKGAALVQASGTIQGTFQNNRLELKGNLSGQGRPLLAMDLSLPLRIQLRPPSASLIYEEKANGTLSLDGRIEEVLDLFDLGTHRVEGNISAKFSLQNTLIAPKITGSLSLNKGYYENYLTGTRLLNLEAQGQADGQTFFLESFSAEDEGGGAIAGTGEIGLLPARKFPFSLDLHLKKFHIAQIDLVTAEADGNVRIEGNLDGAEAKGKLLIVQSNLHIPDRIPKTLPNLVVVYKNAQKPIPEPQTPSRAPYPLNLDLEIQAPDGIFIDGRGLDSEWKGDFHLGGTFASIAALGKLELIKGEFLFSGRRFKLLESSLSFSGKEREMPNISLTAQIDIKDISITARLKGPLNNPQLTFQSSPPLPLSKIMSYLLFGQEIAEINSFQALQLANSLAAFAGQGPDVLESTRKALGVDRLNIVSVSSGDSEVEDTIALQVGKYVSEGVLVSLTQGAEESSTNINIEIEVKGGWTFQLESDQRQEQGKFTIKWNHNY